jgi:hypothetical protein
MVFEDFYSGALEYNKMSESMCQKDRLFNKVMRVVLVG